MPILYSLYFFHSDKGKNQIPLLLIHGAGGCNLSWPPQIRRLTTHTVYAIDLPAHGNSQGYAYQTISDYSSFLINWLDRMQIKQIHLCGHSMGGAIAMQMALQAANIVKRLIIVSSAARLKVNPQILDFVSHSSTAPKALELLLKYSFSETTPSSIIQQTARSLASTRPSVLYNDFLACDAFDLGGEVNKISCPTLILVGSEDKMTPPRLGRWLAQSIPQSQYIEIQGAGHMLPLEQPQMVADFITKFLSANVPQKDG
ncbi:MAG: alpha/beta fold hydrolase [Anaerolineales bacterium]